MENKSKGIFTTAAIILLPPTPFLSHPPSSACGELGEMGMVAR